MQERELRASLQAIGALLPALEYAGELVDGRKRKRICDERGIPIQVKTAATLQDACSALYAQHPIRALELARSERSGATLLELAELCGATPSAVALQLKATAPKKSHKRRTGTEPIRKLKAKPLVKVLVLLEPELKAYAQEVANLRGHGNMSKVIRDAIWRVVALEMPQAPLHPPKRVQAPGRPRRAG